MNLTDQIEERVALGRKLLTENPIIDSLTLNIEDVPVKEIEAYPKEPSFTYGLGSVPSYMRLCIHDYALDGRSIWIHVRSVPLELALKAI
jgi:hypothetical protein